MPTSSILLPDQLRYGLRLNPKLGAGNFLHNAYAVNASRETPLVYSDRPCRVPGGEPLSALSLAQLKESTDKYAAWFLSRGIAPMDPVAVYFAEGVEYVIQYIALTAIGAVPILTNGAMSGDMAAQHFRRVGAVGIVTDREHRAALADLEADGLKCFDCIEDIPGGNPSSLPPWFPFEHDYDDPVMITHSSGTTGVPKPVVLRHGGWFHGLRHLLGMGMAQGADRYLSSLPASHNASIAYAIHAILNGAALMIMGDRSGEAVARAIEHFRPATVVSFPQTFVELAGLDLNGYDLSSVTTWINSGDAAHETHIRRLVAHGYHYRGEERVPGSQFVDGLGSSEMGHSSFRIIHTPYTDSYDRCVGLPQTWIEAAVLDPDGEPVPNNVVGSLGIRSPSITPGYWNDSVLTYKSRLRGYWLTGDLVYRDHMGCYYHVDRVSDVIPTAEGPLYSLQTEELILKYHGNLVDCTVVGVDSGDTGSGEQAAVALVLPQAGSSVDAAAMLDDINRTQAEKGRPLLERVITVERGEVPLGVTGKVLKRTLRELLKAGAF
jgi:acyl-coenzyme A synthetase/AMP-(fatty) acid ligase